MALFSSRVIQCKQLGTQFFSVCRGLEFVVGSRSFSEGFHQLLWIFTPHKTKSLFKFQLYSTTEHINIITPDMCMRFNSKLFLFHFQSSMIW